MKRIPIPNDNAGNHYGVELNKKLKDGKKAIGVVEVTDTSNPYKPDDILLRINAWQVKPNGQSIIVHDQAGRSSQRKIREIIVSVPRSEYTHEEADRQVDIAAAALDMIADEIPEDPTPLPPVQRPADVPAGTEVKA